MEQVRQIRGAIARLEDQLAELREGLSSVGGVAPSTGMTQIIRIVANDYALPAKLLCGDWRRRDMVEARRVAMWIAREGFGRSLASIGAHMGRRDHKTVSQGVEAVITHREADPEFRSRTDRLRDEAISTIGGH